MGWPRRSLRQLLRSGLRIALQFLQGLSLLTRNGFLKDRIGADRGSGSTRRMRQLIAIGKIGASSSDLLESGVPTAAVSPGSMCPPGKTHNPGSGMVGISSRSCNKTAPSSRTRTTPHIYAPDSGIPAGAVMRYLPRRAAVRRPFPEFLAPAMWAGSRGRPESERQHHNGGG